MPLKLHPLVIGEPDWRMLQPGEPTKTLDQWLRLSPQQWETLPWFSDSGFVTRLENNYRRPVSHKAKWQAWWAAAPKYVKYRILRLKQK